MRRYEEFNDAYPGMGSRFRSMFILIENGLRNFRASSRLSNTSLKLLHSFFSSFNRICSLTDMNSKIRGTLLF